MLPATLLSSSFLKYAIAAAAAAAALTLALLAVFNAGKTSGKNEIQAQLLQMQIDLDKANELIRQKNAIQEKEVITVVEEKIKVIHVKGNDIIKEVKVYVPQKSDDACIVPLGFVSVYDSPALASNATQTQDPAARANAASTTTANTLPLSEWIEQPSGVPLSRIAQVNAQNITAFNELKQRYEGLIAWANTQCYAP